jgi:hypothetical protein
VKARPASTWLLFLKEICILNKEMVQSQLKLNHTVKLEWSGQYTFSMGTRSPVSVKCLDVQVIQELIYNNRMDWATLHLDTPFESSSRFIAVLAESTL